MNHDYHFFFGVANLVACSFLFGGWPEHFWVVHTMKTLILLPLVFLRRKERKVHYYMMDLCWVMCSLSSVFGLSLAFLPIYAPEFIS